MKPEYSQSTIVSSVPKTVHANYIVYSQLILTMLIWGAAWPVGRVLAAGLPTVSIAVIRYVIVVPVLFLILRFREGKIHIRREWIPTLVLLGIFSTTLYQIFFLYGVKYAAASDDSIVIGAGPVMIGVLASVYAQERLTKWKILGLLVGLSGVVLIGFLSPNTGVLNRPLGLSLVFFGALSYALYTILLRRFVQKTNSNQEGIHVSSLSINSWMAVFGLIFLAPFSLVEQPWNYAWSFNSWIGILYLALLSTIVGYYLYIEGVTKIGAGRASIFSNLVPVFGVLTSALILQEAVSVWTVVSLLLILTGVYLVNTKRAA
ncbi:MAG TPA: DMT family transporter [Candidatus Bathyarchaeia archaeon]|nr:DMT family transporter [Candidatus Bathyarchaeia archaeon]